MDSDDLAAQEAAAREYQPEFDGPLIGDKTSTLSIVQEYANANPTYVQKSTALPHTFSHYRPVRGDGNCGWRAMGFSYFETLIILGDQVQIESEVSRITSLNQIIITVGGFDRYLFEDMAEETISLLKELAAAITVPGAALAILSQRFNNPDSSNAIIYHLRLLASSCLKLDAPAYEPFIPHDIGLAGYCSITIEQPNRQIDALGITLLFNYLFQPIDFVLEIAYLDQSPGPVAQVYRFPETAANRDPAELGPIISLLFRPEHYDILYRIPPAHAAAAAASAAAAATAAAVPLHVNRVTTFSSPVIMSTQPSLEVYSSLDYELLAMIPGFASAYSPMPLPEPLSVPVGLDIAAAAATSAPASPMVESYGSHAPVPWMTHAFPDPVQTVVVPPLLAPPRPPSAQPPLLAHMHRSCSPRPLGPAPRLCRFRFGKEIWDLKKSDFHEPPLTSNTFRNSHFNRAHYNNPEFHPEEWTPVDDGPDRVASPKRKGRP